MVRENGAGPVKRVIRKGQSRSSTSSNSAQEPRVSGQMFEQKWFCCFDLSIGSTVFTDLMYTGKIITESI
jgi:hypothetical protein